MRSIAIRAGALAGIVVLAGCTETPGLPGSTYEHFQNFKRAPFHRAYAIARNVNGSYSAIFVGGKTSKEAAEAAALARCRSYASQKLYTDPSGCRIYAVDDTILSTGTKIVPAVAGNWPFETTLTVGGSGVSRALLAPPKTALVRDLPRARSMAKFGQIRSRLIDKGRLTSNGVGGRDVRGRT